MRRFFILISGLLILNSCIPIRIAPSISDYKITSGKRFKKRLPKKNTFIFEDPKEAGEFYNYVNTKYNLEDHYVDAEVPFEINGKNYFFSFYEVKKKNKAIFLLPFIFDIGANAALGNDDFETYTATEDTSIIRVDSWYIAIEVFSKEEKDCLDEDSISREVVLPYLSALKKEYLSTHNYNEVVFKN